ncbi:PadR family transcriptional regulator [Marinoscillum sp.]|uniref:PadR family transcriptional regulator n=1 Tax=Marinoscillum sp. TaxID=2024838 RepID=UPI003BAD04E0
MKGSNLGEFEELVLLTIVILQEDAYILKIQEELKNQANRSVVMGALHTTLSRLEKKGFLRSELGDATSQRGGRRKRLYELTAAGKAVLREVKELRENMYRSIPDYALKYSHG